jgi:enamine deaminase RidA (YjgF/YER057c/UK114 family)
VSTPAIRASERTSVPGTPGWADLIGYSRAVRIGPHVAIAGTLPADASGALIGGDDAHLQARHVLNVILAALAQLGARPEHVIRTRIYLRDFADLEAVARAHREVFGVILPVCTCVRVDLAGPQYRVQMDADAYVVGGDA